MRRKNRPSLLSSMLSRKAGNTHSPSASRKSNLLVENLERRDMLSVTTFQQGVSDYTGNQDTILYSISPNVNFGTDTGMSVDQQDIGGVRQGLDRFDDIIGSNPNQIPVGSTINSATLTFQVFNDSNSAMQMSMYRMLADWDQSVATWNTFGAIGGVQASEGEVESLPPDAILFNPDVGIRTFDVSTSLRHWAAGEANHGWLFESAATNGWDFNTSEASLANRPVLTVDFTPPSGSGQFRFLNLVPIHTEGDSGTTTALLSVARVGGGSGAVSVDFDITAGAGAVAGEDFDADDPSNDTLTFLANETVKTIPVTIHGDTRLEGLATVLVTLANAQGGATIDPAASVATLTIGDDDALINEVLANVTTVGDETNREYIELIGTPGESLAGYYFVIFEGEEEENGGAGSGIADLVVDLSGQTFGDNGLLVITGTNWAYTKDAGTNQMTLAALDGTGGKIEDSSQTYALIRSTTNPMVQGTDYDTVGAYEATPRPELSIGTGVGILDQLPVGAQIVDSVGVVEGGGGDRDRVATTAAAGHPGVHVHQPDGPASSGGVTSDAVTRRFGQHTPSTIGVWFNGDIPNGAIPAAYAHGTTTISVVTPAGAQITPGAPNIQRIVGFLATAVNVDESAGTATLTVTRVGDDTTAIDVSYATVNGSALAGLDYVLEAGTLHFNVGDSSEDIVIDILSDSVPEGFKTFGVNLSSPTSPFLITARTATVTINDADVQVLTFQEGDTNNYSGTSDTTLNSIQSDDPFGGTFSVSVDEEVGALIGTDARPSQALLRFDNLFGATLGQQVPQGSQIFSAFLTLNVNNPTSGDAQVRLFRMLQSWDEGTATWSDPRGSAGDGIANGVTPDDVEATAEINSVVTNPGGSGLVNIPLDRDTIQAWASGALPNLGWAIISDSGNDWNFNSSDSLDPSLAPKLTILYTAPSGQGTFGFSDTDFKVNENGTASVTVARTGGSSGAVNLNYEIAAGTGSLGDITGSAMGTLSFGDGELLKTITIPIVNDADLERNETLNLTLSGAVTLDRPSATLTIRDNDFNPASAALLLNEVFINSPGNDGGHEFIELSGTAGIGMGSLYVMILSGDVGPTEGTSDLVVDLGSFLNGANGHTLITAQNTFDFNVPAGATQIGRPELDFEIVSNDTATYALLYSPSASLLTGSYDYDWDNDGSHELPAGVVFVDSVANKDNGAEDQTYGPAANIINSSNNPDDYVADAISRKRGNSSRNNSTAWFHGDLVAFGDDPLVYEGPHSVGAPSPGTALTPGEINTGTIAQSPLVSLTGIAPSVPVGTVTLTFNGPVSQFLAGGGAAGVTITKTDGTIDPRVNAEPVVAGLGTNALTLTFTGPGVSGGFLPAGSYQLNFVGNSLIGNGRAVDTANTALATGSNFEFEFTQPLAGDVNNDNVVNIFDINFVSSHWADTGAPGIAGDANADGIVNIFDINLISSNWSAAPGGGTGLNEGGGAGANVLAAEDGDHSQSTGLRLANALAELPSQSAANIDESGFDPRAKFGRWLSAADTLRPSQRPSEYRSATELVDAVFADRVQVEQHTARKTTLTKEAKLASWNSTQLRREALVDYALSSD